MATSPEEWESQQLELAQRVSRQDDAEWLAQGTAQDRLAGLHLVAGLDVSFFPAPASCGGGSGIGAAAASAGASGQDQDWSEREACPGAAASSARGDQEAEAAAAAAAAPGTAAPGGAAAGDRALAALAALSFPSLQLLHLETLELTLDVPYLPGLLGFREVPAYLELLRRAAARGVHPQLLLVDGFGVLHPRRCGAASQLGVATGLPAVGVAKHLLQLEGLQERQVRAQLAAATGNGGGGSSGGPAPGSGSSAAAEHCRGGWLPLAAAGGEVLGAALCAHGGGGRGGRPIYVSVGHRLSLDTAVEVVRRCCRHRVPEPIRQADLLSRAEVHRLQQQRQQQQHHHEGRHGPLAVSKVPAGS